MDMIGIDIALKSLAGPSEEHGEGHGHGHGQGYSLVLSGLLQRMLTREYCGNQGDIMMQLDRIVKPR